MEELEDYNSILNVMVELIHENKIHQYDWNVVRVSSGSELRYSFL